MQSHSPPNSAVGDQYNTRSDASYPSASYRRFLAQLDRFARDANATIVLEGESGTGKTSLARFIHARSPRAGRPFQQVVLSTLDDALSGSELFGHVSGAYTDARQTRTGQFASASGGTIFLDEIGKTSMAVQYRLLHVVEYGEFTPVGADRTMRVDVRLVAATNLSLAEAVAHGRFLPDLYARLSAFRVRVPSLRERRADIPMLVQQSLRKHVVRSGIEETPSIHPALMAALQRAEWPHNLRQLDAAMHRILVDAEGASELTLAHCEDESLNLRAYAEASKPLTADVIADAIASEGSVSAAARLLKVDRTTIHRHRRRAEQSIDLANESLRERKTDD